MPPGAELLLGESSYAGALARFYLRSAAVAATVARYSGELQRPAVAARYSGAGYSLS